MLSVYCSPTIARVLLVGGQLEFVFRGCSVDDAELFIPSYRRTKTGQRRKRFDLLRATLFGRNRYPVF